MKKMYAFLWHASNEPDKQLTVGSFCESAEVEKSNMKEARKILSIWLMKKQKACRIKNCEHTTVVTKELTQEMAMYYIAGMVKVK